METVLNEIKKEHDEARELIHKIDESERITWKDVEELYVMLRGHHHAEEQVVFPAVRLADEGTVKLVDHLLKEHGESESGLLTLIEVKKFDRQRFQELSHVLEEHMKEEETTLFKKARTLLSEETLAAVLEPFEKAEEEGKKTAETEIA